MKYILCALMFILFTGNEILGQVSVSTANQHLQSGEYDNGIEVLLQILEEGNHSKDLYSNLGYAYLKKMDFSQSILNYERALKLAPNDKEVKEALSHARSVLPVQITDIPDFILVRMYRSVVNSLNSTIWSMIQLILGLALSVFLYKWLFVDLDRKWHAQRVTVLSVLLIAASLTSLFSFQKKKFEIGGNEGISKIEQTVFQSPDDRSTAVVTIGPGNKVLILDKIGNWYKVQLADKDIGWLKKSEISII